jgi:hypothetical protein
VSRTDSFRLDDEEIDKRVDELRKELNTQRPDPHDVKSYVPLASVSECRCRLKPHQVHDLAAAKEKELEKMRRALGIRDDYVEGDAFKQMNQGVTE